MAVAIIVIWVIAALIVATIIGNNKGRAGLGFVLGLLLGWIGVIVIACVPPTQEARIRRAQRDMQVQAAAQRRIRGQLVSPVVVVAGMAVLVAGCDSATSAASHPAMVSASASASASDTASSAPPIATSSPTSSPVPTVTVTAQPSAAPPAPAAGLTNAEAVVTQFYQDITDANYAAAWALGGDNISGGVSYANWVAGYSTTASITLGSYSQFGSSTVDASLVATQTDGTVKTYQGTYTVSGGVIVSAQIVQTS
jgi:hypothetical protein